MRYVKVTDDKERKRILKQLGAQSNKRRCGLLGILYTDELTIYVLNTPGPHWMFCLIVDYNDHRYCLRGDCIYSRIIWNIDIIGTVITDSDEIKKMISLVLESARHIRIYDDAELGMISRNYEKLIIQNMEETIHGIHLY